MPRMRWSPWRCAPSASPPPSNPPARQQASALPDGGGLLRQPFLEASMPDRTVTPLRPRAPSGYTDTAALNDIHALLTTGDPGDGALTDIALVLTRTGRPMVAVRDIEITTTETALGWPVACTQAGDTSVVIRQVPGGTGLLIEICTKTAAEHGALRVTLDGRTLHPAHPAGGEAA